MPSVNVDVHQVGAMAFIKFWNGHSRPIHLVIGGVEGGEQFLRMRGNDRYKHAYSVDPEGPGLTVRYAGDEGATLFPAPVDPGATMPNQPSGRYSRFPAVNRDVVPEAPAAPDVFSPEPEEILPADPPEAVAEAILAGAIDPEALADVTPEEPAVEAVVVAEEAEVVVAEASADEPVVTAEVALDLSELDGLNAAKTVAWAGDDPVKRAAVLARELASPTPRKTVVGPLS